MIGKRRDTTAFILLCLIWGSTWIAMKAALQEVPPLFLGGSRFLVAGVVLLSLSLIREGWTLQRSDWPRVLVTSALLIALCYGCLFWGMVHIDSGTAAVLEMGLTPVALLGFAIAFGHEHGTARKFLAIACGIVGLLILFGPGAVDAWSERNAGAGLQLAGATAVSMAAIIYGLGSVLSRPLLRAYSATCIAGLTTVLGGAMLLATSFAIEPGATNALAGRWGFAAWSGWLFLVVFGSLIGYSIYMRLLRDVGATRAGMYAFVSPVIAVLLGVALLAEEITALEVTGMAILLFSAWLAMSVPEAREARGRGQGGLLTSHEGSLR